MKVFTVAINYEMGSEAETRLFSTEKDANIHILEEINSHFDENFNTYEDAQEYYENESDNFWCSKTEHDFTV